MMTITVSELEENGMQLESALCDDLLVTKNNKPLVVVMEYEKYKRIEQYITAMEADVTCDSVEEPVSGYTKSPREGVEMQVNLKEETILSTVDTDTYDYAKHAPDSVIVSSVDEVRRRVAIAEAEDGMTEEEYEVAMNTFFKEEFGITR